MSRATQDGNSDSLEAVATDPESPTGLFLFRVFARDGEITRSALGLDTGGPRELVLWQVDPRTGRAAVLARTRSDADGIFEYRGLLLPARGARLVVAPLGEEPSGQLGVAVVDVPALPAPAARTWLETEDAGAVLRVVPEREPLVLILAGDDQVPTDRVEVAASHFAGHVSAIRFELYGRAPTRVAREPRDGAPPRWQPLGWLDTGTRNSDFTTQEEDG